MTSLCSEVSWGLKTHSGHWRLGKPHKKLRSPSLLPGSQFSVTSPDGPSCSALLCSVVPARRLDSVTWLEGRNPVRGHAQHFWGEGAALLLVCPSEGLPETRSRRPRTIRCLMPQNKRFSFSLAGKLREGMGMGILSRMSLKIKPTSWFSRPDQKPRPALVGYVFRKGLI